MPNCPQCGTDLDLDYPAGLCPRCLIQGAFDTSLSAEESTTQTIDAASSNAVLSPDSRSHEKFMHGIKVLMAKNYIDNLSEETRQGMLEKARKASGRHMRSWLHYTNMIGPNGKRTNRRAKLNPQPVYRSAILMVSAGRARRRSLRRARSWAHQLARDAIRRRRATRAALASANSLVPAVWPSAVCDLSSFITSRSERSSDNVKLYLAFIVPPRTVASGICTTTVTSPT
jgi:hypothetical protein